MARPSVYQTTAQSLLASALIFATAIGYWSVGTYQTSVAETPTATATTTISLGWTLIGALGLSALVTLILLYRHFRASSSDDEE